MGALRTVDGDGAGLIGPDEVQVVIHLIILATGNLGSHETGQHLFRPYILEPLGRYQITKPQVGCLVGNQFCTTELLLLGSELIEEDTTVAQMDGTWVLHTAKLIAWQDDESELLTERIGDARITFHPLQGSSGLVEHLVELGHLLRIGLTIEGTHGATIACTSLLLEVSCHERVEVGGQRTTAVAGHGLPSVWGFDVRQISCSQIRLVEAGIDGAGMIGHEQGVHIVLMTVQRLVVTGEVQLDLVGAGL